LTKAVALSNFLLLGPVYEFTSLLLLFSIQFYCNNCAQCAATEYRPIGLTDLQVRLLAMCCWVITWMDDHLWAGTPPQYVIRRLGQLSLPSLWGR